ncbi:MAG: phospholipase domain-containing protein, partial [Asticcacaulis sp.]
ETGVRRSRALPYRPDVRLNVTPSEVQLTLTSQGTPEVLHVYNRLQPDAIPRRYTVAKTKTLTDSWQALDGAYDLWLLGPGGFHRHYTGRSEVLPIEVSLVTDPTEPLRTTLRLSNPRSEPASLRITAGAYPDTMPAQTVSLKSGEQRDFDLPLAETGGWYDLWIIAEGSAQRLAGRIETGHNSLSDPALGGPASLWQEAVPTL